MTIDVRALESPLWNAQGEYVARTHSSATPLHTVIQVDLDRLLRRYLPAYRVRCPGKRKRTIPAVWADGTDGGGARLRTRCVVALSRLAVGKIQTLDRGAVDALAGTPEQTLHDEFLDNTAMLVPLALGLPNFAFVHPGDACLPAPEAAVGIAVLSRAQNGFFIACHDPVLHDWELAQPIRLPRGRSRSCA